MPSDIFAIHVDKMAVCAEADTLIMRIALRRQDASDLIDRCQKSQSRVLVSYRQCLQHESRPRFGTRNRQISKLVLL
jgi:hypothetical protein